MGGIIKSHRSSKRTVKKLSRSELEQLDKIFDRLILKQFKMAAADGWPILKTLSSSLIKLPIFVWQQSGIPTSSAATSRDEKFLTQMTPDSLRKFAKYIQLVQFFSEDLNAMLDLELSLYLDGISGTKISPKVLERLDYLKKLKYDTYVRLMRDKIEDVKSGGLEGYLESLPAKLHSARHYRDSRYPGVNVEIIKALARFIFTHVKSKAGKCTDKLLYLAISELLTEAIPLLFPNLTEPSQRCKLKNAKWSMPRITAAMVKATCCGTRINSKAQKKIVRDYDNLINRFCPH